MNNITFPSQIRDEFTINPDGSTRTSIRGAARLVGIDHTALIRHFQTGDISPSKLAKTLIEKGFNPGEFSSGGIPEVALALIIEFYSFDAGARCTAEAKQTYRLFSSIGIRAWLHKELNYQPKKESKTDRATNSTLEEINLIFAGISKLSIKPELVESAKLTAIAKTLPHLATAAEEGKKLLSSQMTIPQLPMSPTELGKVLATKLGLPEPISPRRINEALTEANLQTAETIYNSKGKKKLQYKLTEQGENFGQMQLDSASGHGKTIMIVRWHETVLDLIKDAFITF